MTTTDSLELPAGSRIVADPHRRFVIHVPDGQVMHAMPPSGWSFDVAQAPAGERSIVYAVDDAGDEYVGEARLDGTEGVWKCRQGIHLQMRVVAWQPYPTAPVNEPVSPSQVRWVKSWAVEMED